MYYFLSSRFITNLFGIIVLFFCVVSTHATHYSLWEMGVGSLVSEVPAYRGAKGHNFIALPIPYFIYRGKNFKIDKNGIRAHFFRRGRFAIDFSMGLNLPVDNKKVKARNGMKNLAFIVDIGPSFEYRLYDHPSDWYTIWMRVPIRPAYSFEGRLPVYRGIVIAPFLEILKVIETKSNVMQMNIWAGPLFAGKQYNDYFYSVLRTDATSTRKAYQANKGYSGSRIAGSWIIMHKHYSVGLFFRYDNLKYARFEKSPLVETDNYFVWGLSLAWIFKHSQNSIIH